MRFAAIDVECATSDFGNICEIGLVVFDGGIEVDSFRSQVKPVIPEFGDWQRWNLPYSLRELLRAPDFSAVWEDASALVKGIPVVAHNAATVECRHFSAAFRAGEVEQSTMPEIHCSLELARRLWPDLPKHGLKQLARAFEWKLDHHNPVSDARLSALVVQKALEKHPELDVSSLFEKYRLPACTLDLKRGSNLLDKAQSIKSRGGRPGQRSRRKGGLPELVTWDSPVPPPNQIFPGQNYILSGFHPGRKQQLHDRARHIGLKSMSMVTPETDFLVADTQMGPAKLNRCQRYKIPVLSESEFIGLLDRYSDTGLKTESPL